MTLCRNDSDFIPLPMIPLTELAVGSATGRADLARRNQMKVVGAGKIGKLICDSATCNLVLNFFSLKREVLKVRTCKRKLLRRLSQ